MAERRMFTKKITESDAFLDMPLSTQALYFHLNMNADDEGFVNNAKKIQRMINASDDDMRLLLAKNFIIPFDSGVIVIKHWKMHNYIQKDRFHHTVYQDERKALEVKGNGAYTVSGNLMDTECIQDVSKMDTEVRLGKDRLGKDINVSSLRSDTSSDSKSDSDIIIALWNELDGLGNIKAIKRMDKNSNRYKNLQARLKTYTLDDFKEAIDNIRQSRFLQGENKNGWTISFEWFVLPNNFPKVLEGKYNDTTKQKDDLEDWQ